MDGGQSALHKLHNITARLQHTSHDWKQKMEIALHTFQPSFFVKIPISPLVLEKSIRIGGNKENPQTHRTDPEPQKLNGDF